MNENGIRVSAVLIHPALQYNNIPYHWHAMAFNLFSLSVVILIEFVAPLAWSSGIKNFDFCIDANVNKYTMENLTASLKIHFNSTKRPKIVEIRLSKYFKV